MRREDVPGESRAVQMDLLVFLGFGGPVVRRGVGVAAQVPCAMQGFGTGDSQDALKEGHGG